MRRSTLRNKVAALIAATGLVALAGPASAAGPYQVDVGANTTGNHVFTGTATGGISYVVDGNSGPMNMSCSSATMGGSVAAGSNPTGNGVASVASSTMTGCTMLGMNPSFTHRGTWRLNATGVATAAPTDVVRVNVGSISIAFAGPFSSCVFTVSGKVDGTFDEATQKLRIDESGFTGNLSVGSTVTGCLGLISPRAAFDLVTTYDIVSQDGPINFKP